MPDFSNITIDPLAVTALGFLIAVLMMTLGLFGWLVLQGGKRKR